MDKKQFSIDGLRDQTIVNGYTEGKTWNGWDDIFLEKSELIKWIGDNKYTELPNETIIINCPEDDFFDTLIPEIKEGLTVYSMNGYCFSEVE